MPSVAALAAFTARAAEDRLGDGGSRLGPVGARGMRRDFVSDLRRQPEDNIAYNVTKLSEPSVAALSRHGSTMPMERSVVSEIPSEQQEELSSMSTKSMTADATRADIRQRVLDIAALSPEDSRKAALRFTASVLKLPYDRIKRWFYDEVRRVEAHEADQIRAYYEQARKLIEARQQYDAIRAQYLANAHPDLARFAPGELAPVKDESTEAKAAQKVTK